MPRLEFWFDFASTYSYPAAMRIEKLAQATGVTVDWNAFLLGPLFREQGWQILPSTYSPQKENICGEIYSVLVQLSLFLSCVHQGSPAMACLQHGWLAGLLPNPG